MYNLTIAQVHTFFVGDGQWLVHNTCPIGQTGKSGEKILQKLGGEAQQYFSTTQGARIIDQLVKRIAHESKVGYQSLTSKLERQILKEYELLTIGEFDKSVWHFFRSPVTGQVGPSAPLRQLLKEAGIRIKIEE